MQAVGRVALITAEFDPGAAERVGVRVRQGVKEFTDVGYDCKLHELFIDRRQAGQSAFHPTFAARHASPAALDKDGHVRITIVVDEQSVEAFGNGGLASITSLIFPGAGSNKMSLFAEGGSAKLVSMEVVAVPGE
jgi:levanase